MRIGAWARVRKYSQVSEPIGFMLEIKVSTLRRLIFFNLWECMEAIAFAANNININNSNLHTFTISYVVTYTPSQEIRKG